MAPLIRYLADAFTILTTKHLHVKEPMEFAIFESYSLLGLSAYTGVGNACDMVFNCHFIPGRSLSPNDFLSDILSKAERHNSELKFELKKKLWLDPSMLPEDPIEARLEALQLHDDIIKGVSSSPPSFSRRLTLS